MRVARVVLPKEGGNPVAEVFPDAVKGSCPVVDRLGRAIVRFCRGEDVAFDRRVALFDGLPPFQQRVLREEIRVPRGRVTSYGALARMLGKPDAARAVGSALGRNPFPLIVPCHRAVRTDGGLGGFQGGIEMKRALLEMEGVRFSGSGRVLERFFAR